MKTLIKILLLSLLSIPIYAINDSTFVQYFVNGGFGVNDSLYTRWIDTSKTPDDTISTGATSKYIALGFAYDWGFISIEDTGATYDDSLIVEQGIIGYTGSNTKPIKKDTTWYQIPLKDSSWSTVTAPVVDDASIHSYTIYCPLMDLIRIKETNVQAVNNRVTYIRAVFKRIVGR